MGVHINTARDHDLLAETPETILYGSKTKERPPDISQWVPILNCEVFPIDKRRMLADSLLAKSDMTARVAKNDLGGIVPKIDDLWQRTKDGSKWRVVMVDVLSFGNEYRLHSIQLTAGITT